MPSAAQLHITDERPYSMTSFYVSPSSLTYKQYATLISVGKSFGWIAPYVWARESFYPDAHLKSSVLKKAVRAISKSDIFVGRVPGTYSTCIEIGMAYTLCEEVLITARDPVHYTQTSLADAYVAALPNIRRVCCEIDEIPAVLEQEYLNLISPKVR